MKPMSFGRIASRLFPEHFRPVTRCLASDYPMCPELAGTRLGEVLKSFRPGSPLIDAHNRLLGPDRLEAEDGVVVFGEEHQHVSYWGVAVADLAADDPPVLRAENREPIAWHPEFDRLDTFLSVFCLWQAINGAWPFHGAGRTGPNGVTKQLRSQLEPIPLRANGSGLAFFAGGSERIVAIAGRELFAAARTEAAWTALQRAAPAIEPQHET
ncbi:hypothetical protein [Dokdonella koreensis]|nr:hypothetical protein [Dokdonella koreensis]